MFKLGKGKIAKKIVAGIMAGAVCFGTFSVAVPCSAATATITATRTDSLVSGKFTAHKGTVLKIVLAYTEVKKKDPDIKKQSGVQNILAGDYASVSCSRKVSSGYKYTDLMAAGYINSDMVALVHR